MTQTSPLVFAESPMTAPVTTDAAGFLGRGWAFPVRPDQRGRLSLTREDDAIRNSMLLILSTSPGQRVMLPEYGCPIHDLVFDADTPRLRGAVQTMVRASLTRWEPRIDVLDVRVDSQPQRPTELVVRIDYRLRRNNAKFNMVYPFYLSE